MEICSRIHKTIILDGTFKKLQTKRSQHCKIKDLFKKNRKWQIVTAGGTEQQTTQ